MSVVTLRRVPDELDGVITVQWERLGRPGTWLTGDERVAVAAIARRASSDDTRTAIGIDPPSAVAARLVARRAASIDADAVDDLEARGLGRERYVEIVGVVSRVVAIDTFVRGIGRPERMLPAPSTGEPSRKIVAAARRRAGWVPTVGAIAPPTALNAVPDEAAAQEELHGVLYLSYPEMADLRVTRGLTRAQMELVAARVSYLNACSY